MGVRSLLPAFVLLLAGVSAANAQISMIRGKVVTRDGGTINNAIVELRQMGGAMIGQTVTRNDGDFAFTNLAAGEYEVVVSMAGFEPAVQNVRFLQSPRDNFQEVQHVEIVLRPKGGEAMLAPPGVSFAQDVPKAARAAFDKGMGKLREGKSAEGVTLLREAIALFDDYFNAHLMLADQMYRAGADAEALQSLERARQINDREPLLYHLFGLLMLRQQKFRVAEYAFGEEAKYAADDTAANFYRGLALIEAARREPDARQRGLDLDEAEKALDAAWQSSGKRLSAVLLQRARVYEKRGDPEAAARELEAYLKAEPAARNASQIREAIARLRAQKR